MALNVRLSASNPQAATQYRRDHLLESDQFSRNDGQQGTGSWQLLLDENVEVWSSVCVFGNCRFPFHFWLVSYLQRRVSVCLECRASDTPRQTEKGTRNSVVHWLKSQVKTNIIRRKQKGSFFPGWRWQKAKDQISLQPVLFWLAHSPSLESTGFRRNECEARNELLTQVLLSQWWTGGGRPTGGEDWHCVQAECGVLSERDLEPTLGGVRIRLRQSIRGDPTKIWEGFRLLLTRESLLDALRDVTGLDHDLTVLYEEGSRLIALSIPAYCLRTSREQ